MKEYVHYLDPFAIHISGNIGVRWYGLAYLFGFLFGYALIYWLATNKKSEMDREKVGDFVAYLAFGTMLGGRFGYCLFYAPDLLISFEPVRIPIINISIPMWQALAVWNGGMASHGGIIGLIVASFLFARKNGYRFFHLLDLTVVAGSLAVFFGRIANFINGELYGRACEGKCYWPVKFPDELRRWVSEDGYKEQLTSLYSLIEKLKLPTSPPDFYQWKAWVASGSSQVNYYVSQILNAVHSGDKEVLNALGPVLIARHPSQLYQAVFEGLFVFIVLVIIWCKPQKVGVLAASWGCMYAVMRILGEQFRMPDAHIGFQWLGLTRGQWLSLVMLIMFIIFLIYSLKRDSVKLGGWK